MFNFSNFMHLLAVSRIYIKCITCPLGKYFINSMYMHIVYIRIHQVYIDISNEAWSLTPNN